MAFYLSHGSIYLSHGSAVRHGSRGSATWGQPRPHLPSGGQRERPTRPGCTTSCQPKRAVCSAVRFAQVELHPFDHIAIGFEPWLLMTASHTLHRAKHVHPFLYLSHGSALRHMALVAPPPGANHVHTFPAAANANDPLAPGAQPAANPNARCVLRSDSLRLNFTASSTVRLDLNRNF
jgi:hypothetical protein